MANSLTNSSSKDTINILLAEGNINDRNTRSLRLRSMGFIVDAATNGMHTMYLLEARKYRLVLIDRQMEDMSGLEILALLRHRNVKQQLPVIMMLNPEEKQALMDNNENADLLLEEANLLINHKNDFKNLLEEIHKLLL